MENNLFFEFSGELSTEVKEAQKLNYMGDKTYEEDKKVTSTLGCGSFLTIYCC